MAAYLFWEFIILIVGVWLMATLFFVYGWLLLKRQKQMVLNSLCSCLPPSFMETPRRMGRPKE